MTSAKVNKIIERLKFGEKVEKELNHTWCGNHHFITMIKNQETELFYFSMMKSIIKLKDCIDKTT